MSEELETTPVATNNSPFGIPVAIVIAAALIAGAIAFTGNQQGTPGATAQNPAGQPSGTLPPTQVTPEGNVAPLSKIDNVRGNPKAPVVIIEYSDYDCPWCKVFHETMKKVMDEYGTQGKVAWAYRQFPVIQLHPNAPKLSEAALCVSELGGSEAFWKFSDSIFEERAQNTQTDMTKLAGFASQAGVKESAFTTCLTSGKHTQAVTDAVKAAQDAGARGTPYSVILAGDQKVTINGAEPFEQVKQKIDAALTQLGE